jgi:PKHD-type hydroxylase
MPVIKPFRFLPTIKRKDLNPDFADYVWFTNFFTEEEVTKIRSVWSDEMAKTAAVNNAGKEEMRDELRKSQIMFLKPGEHDWIYEKLSAVCIQTNTNRYKFEITGFQTELQLANYSNTDFFDWHMDFGAGDISNRKLSITVQLSDSDEYEGGDLQFMINQNIVTAPRTKGTAIIFPSFALHRVCPVTKGSRKSIVGWIAGPPYK